MGQHGGVFGQDRGEPPRVQSWITPKAAKGGASAIAGQGVHAVVPIGAGEVVAVKGGHIVDGRVVTGLPEAITDSVFPLALPGLVLLVAPGQDQRR